MKTKVVVFTVATLLSFNANADRFGHGRYGHSPARHHGHGNHWIAPAIIGGVIAGSALYEATRDREDRHDAPYYRQELATHETREEQLRRREIELEHREREYYERQRAQESEDNETCREYYRNDGGYSYYSRNCWER